MKIAIVISSPPLRQVFRGEQPRAVCVIAERALWPLLEAGSPLTVTVQCSSARTQAQLNDYFNELIATEREFRLIEAQKPDPNAKA